MSNLSSNTGQGERTIPTFLIFLLFSVALLKDYFKDLVFIQNLIFLYSCMQDKFTLIITIPIDTDGYREMEKAKGYRYYSAGHGVAISQ